MREHQLNNEKPLPGKPIEFLEGEIISIQYSQWGTTGKIKTDSGIYRYLT